MGRGFLRNPFRRSHKKPPGNGQIVPASKTPDGQTGSKTPDGQTGSKPPDGTVPGIPVNAAGAAAKKKGFGGLGGTLMNGAFLASMFIPFENLFGGGGGGDSGPSPEDLKRQEQMIQQSVPLISCCCCSVSSFLSLVLLAVLLMG